MTQGKGYALARAELLQLIQALAAAASSDDIAELAARLGSINTFDRRGEVVWFDDFEGGLGKWFADGSGTDNDVAEATDHVRNGAKSVKLTTGRPANKWASINHFHAYPYLGRIGVECSFMLYDASMIFAVEVEIDDGGGHHSLYAKFNAETGELTYEDGDGNPAPRVTGLSYGVDYYTFNTIKLVFDSNLLRYVRLLFNDIEYDMSALPYYAYTPSETKKLSIRLIAFTLVATNRDCWVDDFILTQNEP